MESTKTIYLKIKRKKKHISKGTFSEVAAEISLDIQNEDTPLSKIFDI